MYTTFELIRKQMAKEGKRAATCQGEWQLVQCRCRYPDHWKNPHSSSPVKAKPFIPYSKSYAQAVTTPPQNSIAPTPPPQKPIPPPPIQIPTNPSSPSNHTATYISPHSPTTLRFLPRSPSKNGRVAASGAVGSATLRTSWHSMFLQSDGDRGEKATEASGDQNYCLPWTYVWWIIGGTITTHMAGDAWG